MRGRSMKPGFFNSESPSTLLLQKACFLTLHTFISLTHTVMNASQSLPETLARNPAE